MAGRDGHHRDASPCDLTGRQQEVLGLIAKGRTNGQIATELGISLAGVKWHVGEILGRLGVESREDAVVAWRNERRPAIHRRWIGSGFMFIKAASGVVAGLAVVVAAVTGVGSLLGSEQEPQPTPVETATATVSSTPAPPSLAAGQALPNCSEAGLWIAPLRGFAQQTGLKVGGYTLVPDTPCRASGEFRVALANVDGSLIQMPGNPATVPFDVAIPFDSISAPGVLATWRGWCAYHAPEFRVIITISGHNEDEVVVRGGDDCDEATPMSLTLEEAVWSRRSYLADLVPPGTWSTPSANPPLQAGVPKCAVGDVDICGTLDRLDRWNDTTGSRSGVAAYGKSDQYACGGPWIPPPGVRPPPSPYGHEVRLPEFPILPIDHPYCSGKAIGELVFGTPARITSTAGEVRETLMSNYFLPGSLQPQDFEPVSYGCFDEPAGCQRFAIAVTTASRDVVVTFVYQRMEDEPGYAMVVGFDTNSAPTAAFFSGGGVLIVLGDIVLKPLS